MFDFPEYYGFNWDSFDDCIYDIPLSSTIVVTHFDELRSKVPRGAKLLEECLIEFAKEESNDIMIEFSPAGRTKKTAASNKEAAVLIALR